MITVAAALQQGVTRLQKISETPRLDAEVLLAHAAGRDRTWCLTATNDPLVPAIAVAYDQAIVQRAAHVPVAYITGEKEFYSLPLAVTPDVLIPRPDSELFIDVLRDLLPTTTTATIVDVGTGSGALALAAATVFPQSTVIATDISRPAIAVAQRNIARHNLTARVTVRWGDLLAPVSEPFQVLLANLPYLTLQRWKETAPDVRAHEPIVALTSETDGLTHYRRLFQQLALRPADLLPDIILLEADPEQMEALKTLAQMLHRPYTATIHTALNGLPRVCALTAVVQ